MRTKDTRGARLSERSRASGRHGTLPLLPLFVLAAGIAAYANSFDGVLLFDDVGHIVDNHSIRQLQPVWKHLIHARRPIVNLSLAVNYAISQLDVWGYHLFNLTVHLLAALTLFGVIRRTLLLEPLKDAYERSAPWLAMTAAIIWVVHPLQTQSVTYLIQRGESMMGLFYLLTLYCFIRTGESRHAVWWHVGAVTFCALGMGCKAVIVTAPAVILLYDCIFISRSFTRALRHHWALYTGLTATWSVLFACGVAQGVLNPSAKSATVGFGNQFVTPLEYALSQPGVILHYLELCVWPSSLCLDYAWPVARTTGAIVAPALVIVALLVSTIWALPREPAAAFLGIWFFLVLSPTSSIVPIRDLHVEHRMYLSSAAIILAAVMGGYRVLGLLFRPLAAQPALRNLCCGCVIGICVTLLGYTIVQRNRDYHSRLTMWQDVVAKRPLNARGYGNLGRALIDLAHYDEAIDALRESLRLNPQVANTHRNMGVALWHKQRLQEAIEHYNKALQLKPNFAEAHTNLAIALFDVGRRSEAMREHREALQINPNLAHAHFNYGFALRAEGRLDEAIESFRRALRIDPLLVAVYSQLGFTLDRQNRLDEAVDAYRKALLANPQDVKLHIQVGGVYHRAGKLHRAIQEYNAALQIDANHYGAWYNLGVAYAAQYRNKEASRAFHRATIANPDFVAAYFNLGRTLAQQGRFKEAIDAYRETVRLQPDHTDARRALAAALAELDRSGASSQP